MADRKTSVVAGKAEADLARLGYQSELPRNLSMVSVLGLSFAIMAVPLGLSTGLYFVLIDGQAVTMLWGWVIVSLISLAIAASLAEICAVYPTAGGVYYWSAMLATKEWAPITSWITGWLTLVGNWTVTLAINFSFAQLILAAIQLWDTSYVPKQWHTVLMFWGVMLMVMSVNIWLAKYLDFINKLCIYWTSVSVIIILIVLLTTADHRHSGAFVFSHYDSSESGWQPGWAFFVGLLEAAYTLTGYGMVAAMCEEVQNPEREVPKAIVLSVAGAGITGLFFIIPLLFVLPDIGPLLAVTTNQPIGLLFQTVTGSAGGAFGLLILIYGIAFFSGVGSLTASSRCTYAFARDGAIPFSHIWSKVNHKYDIPLMGLFLSVGVDCALACIYFGSTAAFNSFVGVATICLSTSYGLPILILVLRRRNAVRNSSFSLGRFGYAINITTIIWISFAIALFCFPIAKKGLTPNTMNYASVVFVSFGLISVGWYFYSGRKNFTGPPVPQDVDPADIAVVRGEIVGVETGESGKLGSPSSSDEKFNKETI